MTDIIFKGVFDSDITPVIGVESFLLCIGFALIPGIMLALCYMYKTRYSKSFLVTLALLPAVVCVVIMMVNGNVGAGVAVAGAFSLVRFRSVPGSAKEICILFLAMGAGLIMGMGYIAYSILFTVIMCMALLLYNKLDFGAKKQNKHYKSLRITIPEDLDYTGVFDDIFNKYCDSVELSAVKTVNMGSLFRLTYNITLKDSSKEKEFIDSLRIRNGNLEISISVQSTAVTEL